MKVMEEKVGRPKRPDNILPLLMPNYEQKTSLLKNKQTNDTTTRQDKGQCSKKINHNLKSAFS